MGIGLPRGPVSERNAISASELGLMFLSMMSSFSTSVGKSSKT